jgi:hypothetical protein
MRLVNDEFAARDRVVRLSRDRGIGDDSVGTKLPQRSRQADRSASCRRRSYLFDGDVFFFDDTRPQRGLAPDPRGQLIRRLDIHIQSLR